MDRKTLAGKPPWLKVRACGDRKYLEVLSLLRQYKLHTVCQEANCPNRGECFSSGTATFLILGPNCTRACTFCNVKHGPVRPVDDREPEYIVRAAEILALRHVVVTSVTRDDLDDGGAGHFARVIRALRKTPRDLSIEVLTPDFRGRINDITTVLEASPDVFNHNVETVPRLYHRVRPGADYHSSLDVLREASRWPTIAVKSGLMVGLGETTEELNRVFHDLKQAGVQYLTIGQYLAPSANHHPVARFYTPDEFDQLGAQAESAGITSVFSGPLVRSSYHAGEQFRRGK